MVCGALVSGAVLSGGAAFVGGVIPMAVTRLNHYETREGIPRKRETSVSVFPSPSLSLSLSPSLSLSLSLSLFPSCLIAFPDPN